MTPDNIYANPRASIASFKFDDKVASVFADMIARSVPGYGLTLDMIGVIASRYGKSNSQCYDLGCSLGASTLAMRHNVADSCKIIAIDNSTAMVEKCQQFVTQDSANAMVDVRCDDICNVAIENASLVAMNFTLQFIEADKRADLLAKIYHGLNTGGAFILSEKIVATDSGAQETLTNLHHDFKRAMGYSDLEIAQKRSAIENVLVPSTIDSHRENLHVAGFSQVYLWFQCFNFVSLIAIK
jgi:tRNA (cmo5U34)-methyltransferase